MDTYPAQLDCIDMAEFTKGRSYSTGWDSFERPYVRIATGFGDTVIYTFRTYEQMYVLGGN